MNIATHAHVLHQNCCNADVHMTTRRMLIRLPAYADGGYSWFVVKPTTDKIPKFDVVYHRTDRSGCLPGVVGCSGFDEFFLYLYCPQRGTEYTIPMVALRPFDIAGTLDQAQRVVMKVRIV